ncbi:MAG: transposase [Acidimicrobiales bacterium]
MTRSTTAASCCSSAPSGSTTSAGRDCTPPSPPATPTDALSDTWVGRRRSATCTSPTTSTEPPTASTTPSPGAPPPRQDPSCEPLAKTLRRWWAPILAHHTTGASNEPVEAAMNLLIAQVKRSGRGFRNVHNYRLRILMAGGQRLRRDTPRASTQSCG